MSQTFHVGTSLNLLRVFPLLQLNKKCADINFRAVTCLVNTSRDMRFSTMWCVRPAKPKISLIRAFASHLTILLEFLSLKGGCTGWSESIYYTCQNATLFEIMS